MRRIRSGFAALIAASLISAAVAAGPAQASVPNNFCDPHAYTYIVRNYTRTGEVNPLRCGSSTWGFRHLVARGRWSANFDAWIALTISRGAEVTYLALGGDNKLYAIFNGTCQEEFRVWVNRGAYNGNGVRPQGVISAYWEDTSRTTIAPQAPATAADVPPPPSGGRNDCPVYQAISMPW